jgi:Helix-turn-helix domain/Phage derived protein Gp49-like (DUF891)
MNTVGQGVREIRIRDAAGAFRVMCVATFDDAVYVLHCFQKLLGVTQPRISDLMRGKIELFGLDTLVNMIGAAGLHVEMRISDAA